jgi:hypothetical protein
VPNGPPLRPHCFTEKPATWTRRWHLDAAIAHRDPSLVHLAVAPQWDRLRGDERFGERLLAMGLAAAADRAQRFFQRTMAPRAAT